MDFEQLIREFGKRYGIEGLAASDGAAAITVDGIRLDIIHAKPSDAPAAKGLLVDFVLACAVIGQPPAEGADDFAGTLLRANFLFRGSGGGTLCQNPETKAYALVRPYVLSALDVETFATKLSQLVDQVERWRDLLGNWRIAKEASEESVINYAFAPGFIPV